MVSVQRRSLLGGQKGKNTTFAHDFPVPHPSSPLHSSCPHPFTLAQICEVRVGDQFPMAAVTNHYTLGTLKNSRNISYHSSGGQKSKIKESARPRSPQGLSGRVLACLSQFLVVLGLWRHHSSVSVTTRASLLCPGHTSFFVLRTPVSGLGAHPKRLRFLIRRAKTLFLKKVMFRGTRVRI